MTASVRSARFPALDGVRALAAFAVVCTHVGFVTGRSLQADWLGPLLSRGDFGVTVFFLLSGFLLYRPFALHSFGSRSRPSISDFFRRRALRILPAVWLTTTLTLLFFTVYRVRGTDWLHYLLLIQTYDHHDYDPNLSQLWTLTVEVSFYALLPILAAVVGGSRRGPDKVLRRQVALLAALAAMALAFNIMQSKLMAQTQAALWLPAYLDWFAAGMGLAVLSAVPATTTAFRGPRETLRIWAANPGTCWLVAAALFLLTTLPIGIPRTLAPATFWQWTTQHYMYLGAAFFIMLPLVMGRGGRTAQALGSPFAGVMANLSYSVYLWHVPLMLWLQRTMGYTEFKGHFAALFSLTLLTTVAVAAASWYLFERPILRYGSRPWRGIATAERMPAARAATQSN